MTNLCRVIGINGAWLDGQVGTDSWRYSADSAATISANSATAAAIIQRGGGCGYYVTGVVIAFHVASPHYLNLKQRKAF